MIKDIKNEMDKSTADKIKYCIVLYMSRLIRICIYGHAGN